MYNTEYSYENLPMWDPAAWADHYSPVRYLFHRIEEINHSLYRTKAGEGPYAGREDGEFNAKTMSFFYPEYISKWKDKGLIFHSTEMGSVCWTAMIPTEVYEGKEHAPKILVVLCDADFSDPNWSIHTLTKYDAYTAYAAEQKYVVLYISMIDVNKGDVPFGVMQEFSVIYNLKMDEVLLDVSHLVDNGVKLAQIDGFSLKDPQGNPVADPDARIRIFNGVPVLDISHQWQNRYSGVMEINTPWVQHPKFDREGFIHSQQGRAMADELRIEFDYDYGDDPAFLKKWDAMGLELKSHDYEGYQWISCVPKGFLGQTANKLPVMLIFQEVTYQDRHQVVSAAAAYKNYMELAAEGELIVLFFALESVKDNDRFYDIAVEASKIYPIDMTRVYCTGQSHNGYFCDTFAHRFHNKIAGVAPLSNHPGIPEPAWTTSPNPVSDEMVEEWTRHDMPTIGVTSIAESLNQGLHCRKDDDLFSSAARAYQRRLKSQRCKVPSVEEIIAVRQDPNPVRAEMVYPYDDVWVEYHDGAPVYIGEVVNNEGKRHFRMAMLTNQTHFIAPQMPMLSWEFLKRFARNLETGETIELW